MWGSWTLAHLAWDQYPVLACFAFDLPQAQPRSLFHFGPDLPLSPLAIWHCICLRFSSVSKTQKHADYISHPNCFFSLNSQHSFIISRFGGHKKVSALTIFGLFYSYSFSYIVDCGLSNSTSFSTFPLQRWITTKGRTSQLKNHICLKKIKIVKRPDLHCYHHRGNHLHNATIFQGYETNP